MRSRGLALAALALLLLASLRVASSSPSAFPGYASEAAKVSDLETYRLIIQRVRAGDGYYHALGETLRSRGYATREVFNWRTPLVMSGLSRLSEPASSLLLLVAATAFLVVALVLGAEHRSLMAFGATLVAGSGSVLMLRTPLIYTMGEAWAGLLIAASACIYGVERRTPALLLGLAALFVRELAAVYCLVCLMVAWRESRRTEVRVWCAGFTAYAVYYAAHVLLVLQQRQSGDIAHASSWLDMQGWPFVLDATRWNLWVAALPWWAPAIYVSGISAAILNRRLRAELRLAAVAYMAFFCVAGKSFDTYWGLVAGPLWAVAFGFGLAQSVDLVRSTLRARPPLTGSRTATEPS